MKDIAKRLKAVRKELKMTQGDVAKILGISKSAVCMIERGRAALSIRNKNILMQQLGVNPDWLDEERGGMFICPIENTPYMNDLEAPAQSVPLYAVEATAGLVSLFANPDAIEPVGHIRIPGLPKCDGAVRVAGDNMHPILKSNDIVLYKKQSVAPESVFWGEMYLLAIDIDGDEYVMVRYIHKSDMRGCVKLVSHNTFYADQQIETGRILALAYIKASIRMNAIR